uniref:THO complex subunit 5 n=1 Tax=Romanomermis culicivorax TaxID=13658 RepID=A0A915KC08_ROMCU
MPPPGKADTLRKKILPPKDSTAKAEMIQSEEILSLSFVKEFFGSEDQEARNSDPNVDRDAFLALSKVVFNNCFKIVESKLNNADQSELENMKHELFEQTILNLISMKRMNRLAQLRNKMRRDTVVEDRLKVDELYLQLQNLLYEVSHIEQEVARCTDFKSADENIELVSVNQFYEEADPEISRPKITKNDKHLQALARLQWELKCRQTLASEIDKVRQEKDDIEKEIEAKQALLDSLQPKLEGLLEASKPVQELFGVNYEQGLLQTKSANYLPAPLFYAYVQISAYKDMFDPSLTITIDGDLDKALQFGTDNKSNKVESSDEEMVDESIDNEIDRRKKSRKMNRRLTITDAEEEKVPDINSTPHPLYLHVKINCRDQAVLSLFVSCIPNLGIVTVKTKLELKADVQRALATASELLEDDVILTNLLDNDDSGDKCPNSVSRMRLKQAKQNYLLNFDLVGRPYKWAQVICGIQFVNNVRTLNRESVDDQAIDTDAEKSDFEGKGDDANDASCLQTTLKAIKRRILARENIRCEDCQKRIILAKTDGMLSAFIYVHCDYPALSPLILLKLEKANNESSHDNLLRHLERAVNVECPLKIPKNVRNQILCVQIRYLLNRLDVVRELLTIEAADKSVKREHLYKKLARGRDRQPPLSFNSLENCWNFELK